MPALLRTFSTVLVALAAMLLAVPAAGAVELMARILQRL